MKQKGTIKTAALLFALLLALSVALVSCGKAGPQGEPGAAGKDGAQGQPGADGLTPHIGENGNWWLGDRDTGVRAEGGQSDDGLPPSTGTGIQSAYINEEGHLILVREDGTELDAGRVSADQGSSEDSASPADEYYTVTFEDHDGTRLFVDSEVVRGGTAKEPEAPGRKGYAFTGWSKSVENVTENITVTALYEQVQNQIYFDYTVSGAAVSVTVSMEGALAVCGFEGYFSFDCPGLTLTEVTVHEADGIDMGMADLTEKNGTVYLYFNDEGGANITEAFSMLTFTFAKTDASFELEFHISDIEMFDASNLDCAYTVSHARF